MVKVVAFNRTENYESKHGSSCKVIHSPEYYFAKWDQADVESIVSIHTHCNSNGTCTQILVFYEPKEAVDEQ